LRRSTWYDDASSAQPEALVNLWSVAAIILLLNVPFGIWRAGVRRFSVPWFVAVHAPVPLAIGLRIGSGLGWRIAALPVFVAAYCAGQFLGGRLRARRQQSSSSGSGLSAPGNQ